jgi:hypothetical protein
VVVVRQRPRQLERLLGAASGRDAAAILHLTRRRRRSSTGRPRRRQVLWLWRLPGGEERGRKTKRKRAVQAIDARNGIRREGRWGGGHESHTLYVFLWWWRF